MGRFGFWRWGESNPRPRARTASVYRFVRPIELSGRGVRIGAHPLPYPGFSPQVPPGRNLGKPRSVTSPATAQGGAAADPSLSALTRRERNCRCCWQLKVCRIRRSAAPPATRDPDRSGRDRCTPGDDVARDWTHPIRGPSKLRGVPENSESLGLQYDLSVAGSRKRR
jgi:hypothetical protein